MTAAEAQLRRASGLAPLAALVLGGTGVVAVVLRYGRQVPATDDWNILPFISGERHGLGWLWTPNAGHRIPVVRLVLWATVRISGYDYRWPTFLNCVFMMAASAIGLWAAHRIRGRLTIFDAVIPTLFLNPRMALFTWAGDTHFTVQALATTCFVALMLTQTRLTARRLTLLCALGVLFSLNGLTGVITVPFVVAWLLWSARFGHADRPLVRAAVIASAALVVLAAVPVFPRPETLGHAGPRAIVAMAIHLLGGGITAKAYGGYAWMPPAQLLAALVVGLVLWARFSTRSDASTHARSVAFGVVVAYSLTLAFGIGYGRAGVDHWYEHLSNHYGVLFVPLLLGTYLAAIGLKFRTATAAMAILVVFVPLSLAATARTCVALQDGLKDTERRLLRDARAGASDAALATRYHELLTTYEWQIPLVTDGIRILRDHGGLPEGTPGGA